MPPPSLVGSPLRTDGWTGTNHPWAWVSQAAASDDLAWATGGLLLWAFVQPTKPTHFPELMM